MVNDDAQLYTIEGIAAALLMLLTTYYVLGGVALYAPGDTHITDLQLEQIGNDFLAVIDVTNSYNQSIADEYTKTQSPLEWIANCAINNDDISSNKAFSDNMTRFGLRQNYSYLVYVNTLDGATHHVAGENPPPGINSVNITRMVRRPNNFESAVVIMRLWPT